MIETMQDLQRVRRRLWHAGGHLNEFELYDMGAGGQGGRLAAVLCQQGDFACYHTGGGLFLRESPHAYLQAELDFLTGGGVQLYSAVGSTNDVARQLLLAGAANGTAVLADTQTAGRGQRGRAFSSPGGSGIYLTVLLRAVTDRFSPAWLTPASAVLASQALEPFLTRELHIKWVNDLFLDGAKVSGILTEAVPGENGRILGFLIGIGVNFATEPALLPSVAGSLRDVLRVGSGRVEAAAALIRAFREALPKAAADGSFLQEYRRRSLLLGSEVKVVSPSGESYLAVAEAIDDDCALVVRTASGRRRLTTGEVSIRPVGESWRQCSDPAEK